MKKRQPSKQQQVQQSFNTAKKYVDSLQSEKAIEVLKETIELAEKHSFLELLASSCYLLASIYYQTGKTDKETVELLQKALQILQKLEKNVEQQAKIQLTLGSIYRLKMKLEMAEIYLRKAISIFEQLPYSIFHVYCYTELAFVNASKADTTAILEFLYRGLTLALKANDKEGMARCHRILAKVLISLNEFEKASEHIDRAIQLKQQINKTATAEISVKGELLLKQNKYKEALIFFNQALEDYQQRPREAAAVNIRLFVGITKMELREFSEAAHYLNTALQTYQKRQQPDKVAYCNMFLGTLYNRTHEYDKAIPHFKNALDSHTLPNESITFFRGLMTAYKGVADLEKALYFSEKFIAEAKYVFADKTKIMMEKQREYEANLKEIQKMKSSFLSNIPHKSATSLTSAEHNWLQSVETLIEKNLSNTQYTVETLASDLHLSMRQLQRRIRNLTQLTPSQYIREIKLQVAQQHLKKGIYQTVSEVAYAVGFNSVHHFSKIYHKRFGKYPSSYFSN